MRIATIFFCLLLSTTLLAQDKNAIVGTWLSEEGKSKVEIFKEGDEYKGKIVWLKSDVGPDGKRPKRDVNNPDEDKRSRPLKGTVIVKNLQWNAEEEEWDEGEIYDPQSGNTYSAYAWLEEPDKLSLKGYVGVSLLGRTTTWTRVK